MTNDLKAVREWRGMTITELSRRSGVARQTIYYLEGDKKRSARIATMDALARALDVKTSKIFSL